MPAHKGTIDFRRVKEIVAIAQVLESYNVALKRQGRQLVGCCPIHKGRNARAFVVDPFKGAWRCFGDCDKGGSVIDLVAELERISIAEAARLLSDRYDTR